MTRQLGLILIIILCIVQISEARLIATLTTNASGGIMGNETAIKPLIAFKGEDPIFSNFIITPDDEGVTFSIMSDIDDPNFSNFITKLTNHHDEYLKVGHKIGMIKSDLGSLESAWFEEKRGFEGKKITRIELTYTKLEFTNPITNLKNMTWTDFKYEIKLSFYDDTTPDLSTTTTAFDDSNFDEVNGFVVTEKPEIIEFDEETKLDATEDYMIVVKKRKPKNENQPNIKLTNEQVKMVLKDILFRWNYTF